MKVRFTVTALRQLDRALTYIEERNPQGARVVKRRIEAIETLLAVYPLSGHATDRPWPKTPWWLARIHSSFSTAYAKVKLSFSAFVMRQGGPLRMTDSRALTARCRSDMSIDPTDAHS